MATEMKSTHSEQSAGAANGDLDPQALNAIRNLIQTEAEEPSVPSVAEQRRALLEERRASREGSINEPAAATAKRHGFDEVRPQEKQRPNQNGFVARIKAKVLGYRPTVRHILLASAALLVIFRPWLVIGLLLLFIMLFVCVFLILGYDGFWQRAIGFGRWYASRRPAKAKELHAKLDAFAYKWDSFLDRFPEGTVDGLYLPDLENLAKADARHDEALDRRLSGLREGDA